MKDILADIALKHLRVPTLSSRGSDKLDFHDIGCTELGDALTAAYEAGKASAQIAPLEAIMRALYSILNDAWNATDSAIDAIDEGKQNQAIGTVLHLEQILPVATSLLNAALALHRTGLKGGVQ